MFIISSSHHNNSVVGGIRTPLFIFKQMKEEKFREAK